MSFVSFFDVWDPALNLQRGLTGVLSEESSRRSNLFRGFFSYKVYIT